MTGIMVDCVPSGWLVTGREGKRGEWRGKRRDKAIERMRKRREVSREVNDEKPGQTAVKKGELKEEAPEGGAERDERGCERGCESEPQSVSQDSGRSEAQSDVQWASASRRLFGRRRLNARAKCEEPGAESGKLRARGELRAEVNMQEKDESGRKSFGH